MAPHKVAPAIGRLDGQEINSRHQGLSFVVFHCCCLKNGEGAIPWCMGSDAERMNRMATSLLIRLQIASPRLRTPPLLPPPPRDPLRAPLGEVLTLGNQTLMNQTGQQGDAVPVHLVADVLAGDADGTGAGGLQDIPLQEVTLLRERRQQTKRTRRRKIIHRY